MLLHVAAGLLTSEDPPTWPPGARGVAERASGPRTKLREGALEARRALGDAPRWVRSREGDMRGLLHDCLHLHHDEDDRALMHFPVGGLDEICLLIFRVSGFGELSVDQLAGAHKKPESPTSRFWSGRGACAYSGRRTRRSSSNVPRN